MRYLVTGGAGFIGKKVVARLREAGHEVTAVDVTSDGSPDSLEVNIGDLGSVWRAFRHADPEVVVQLAYRLGPETKSDPYEAMKVNIHGVNNVFEAARLHGTRRVIFASTIGVHGYQSAFGSDFITEDSTTAAVGPYSSAVPYGSMKIFNEMVARMYSDQFGLEVSGVRLSTLYGDGRKTGGQGPWVSGIVSAPARGEAIEVGAAEGFTAAWLYVDDAAEYFARLSELDVAKLEPVYETGGWQATAGDFASKVREIVPGADIRFDPSRPELGDNVPVYKIDNSKIVAATGHSLRPFEDGITQQVEEVRAQA